MSLSSLMAGGLPFSRVAPSSTYPLGSWLGTVLGSAEGEGVGAPVGLVGLALGVRLGQRVGAKVGSPDVTKVGWVPPGEQTVSPLATQTQNPLLCTCRQGRRCPGRDPAMTGIRSQQRRFGRCLRSIRFDLRSGLKAW